VARPYYEFDFRPGNGFITSNHSYTDAYTEQFVKFSLVTAGIGNYIKISYGQLVRNLYHEIIHVDQQLGITGPRLQVDNKKADIPYHNEREFLAYYRAATQMSLPSFKGAEKASYIYKAVGNHHLVGYYQLLEKHKQIEHRSKMLELQTLLKGLKTK
jgi:hypothetical protein